MMEMRDPTQPAGKSPMLGLLSGMLGKGMQNSMGKMMKKRKPRQMGMGPGTGSMGESAMGNPMRPIADRGY